MAGLFQGVELFWAQLHNQATRMPDHTEIPRGRLFSVKSKPESNASLRISGNVLQFGLTEVALKLLKKPFPTTHNSRRFDQTLAEQRDKRQRPRSKSKTLFAQRQ